MAQMVILGPFQELELAHQNRLKPPTALHFFFRQTLAPATIPLLGQIHEWARRDFKPFEFPEQRCREAGVNPLRVLAAYSRSFPS